LHLRRGFTHRFVAGVPALSVTGAPDVRVHRV
jgi:hypothetical protein